jgi:hypothetical protein
MKRKPETCPSVKKMNALKMALFLPYSIVVINERGRPKLLWRPPNERPLAAPKGKAVLRRMP